MELNVNSAKEFNLSLKQALKELTGLKVTVNILNSYKFPKCWVRIMCDYNIKFPNEFRLMAFDASDFDRKNLSSETDVSYGNINSNMITIHVHEWKKLFENENKRTL